MSEVWADVIFCDDIRQEITGKFLFVGFYPADLVPAEIPAAFPMSACVRVHGASKGHHTFKVRVLSPSGKQMFEQAGGMDLNDDQVPMILVFAGFPMEIETTGQIVAMIEVDGQELPPRTIKVAAPMFPAPPSES